MITGSLQVFSKKINNSFFPQQKKDKKDLYFPPEKKFVSQFRNMDVFFSGSSPTGG